jgi:Flp pilus assembly protein CpaB
MKLSQKRLARPSLGGMLASRQGALLLAFLCALAAAGLVLVALNHYRKNLVTTNQQATVLIASGEIQKGTSAEAIVSDHLYKATPVLSTQVTLGALSDPSLLTGKTATTDILPGQQLTSADFAGAAVLGVAGQLQPDQRAVSITVDEAHGDTDVVQTGDRVDVYALFGGDLVLLVENALVIKPSGAAAATAPAGGTPPAAGTPAGASLVLAVSSGDATKVAFAAEDGKIWILLRPLNALRPQAAQTTLSSILSSVPPTTTTGKH